VAGGGGTEAVGVAGRGGNWRDKIRERRKNLLVVKGEQHSGRDQEGEIGGAL